MRLAANRMMHTALNCVLINLPGVIWKKRLRHGQRQAHMKGSSRSVKRSLRATVHSQILGAANRPMELERKT